MKYGKVLIATLMLTGLASPVWPAAEPDEEGKALKGLYLPLLKLPSELDPCRAGQGDTAAILAQMYEPLYEYDRSLEPLQLKACLARGMPTVSDDGRTWTVELKAGVRFADDPCFPGGKGRELTARDFVYAFMRQADAANEGSIWWLLEGKIVGLDGFREESFERRDAGQDCDYSRSIEGLAAPDDHTLRIRLTRPWPQFVHLLAMTPLAAVPREAVEKYGKAFARHPVGTGPFRLKAFRADIGVVIERNPSYRDDYGDVDGGQPRKLPLLDGVQYRLAADEKAALKMFQEGRVDALVVTGRFLRELVTSEGKLADELAGKRARLAAAVTARVYYMGFCMRDPVVGGERGRKLRQAMSLAFDARWRVDHLYGGAGVVAQGPLPPGVFGHDARFNNPYQRHDLDDARRLLAEAGYPDGKDKDGQPLQIRYDIAGRRRETLEIARVFAEEMARIGITIHVIPNDRTVLERKQRAGLLQVFASGWQMDYPDPENVLQLFYGPNRCPGPNLTLYDNPRYDGLYEKMKGLPNGPERLAIVRDMVEVIAQDAVWIPIVHPVVYTVYHRWVQDASPGAIIHGRFKHLDLDMKVRDRMRYLWQLRGDSSAA